MPQPNMPGSNEVNEHATVPSSVPIAPSASVRSRSPSASTHAEPASISSVPGTDVEGASPFLPAAPSTPVRSCDIAWGDMTAPSPTIMRMLMPGSPRSAPRPAAIPPPGRRQYVIAAPASPPGVPWRPELDASALVRFISDWAAGVPATETRNFFVPPSPALDEDPSLSTADPAAMARISAQAETIKAQEKTIDNLHDTVDWLTRSGVYVESAESSRKTPTGEEEAEEA
ncbi:uncharacterized protein EHS24_009305 [Apiotrichum porosum]|uniref:Uncharacterized protein n=1 Tax=Apiotrichum porosum TaxID=105984 RepID=A0A427XLH3_9TREE|nr:uncharacterized protein EHS24_009305 [Apiotrichum porosum]RSH79653.1 hypothetical protein EHS24_009305 [Apiotrichum porosum]